MSLNITPTVGMEVHVVVVGSDGDIVHGTITNVEQLVLEETDEVLSEHFPTIALDNGKIVNGMECWWSPVDEEKPVTCTPPMNREASMKILKIKTKR